MTATAGPPGFPVRVDRTVAAPVDVVWSLVSTPDGLNEWMSVAAELDLRPGGRIRWRHDNGWVVAGEVLDVVPHRRLAFTFGWESGGFPVAVGSSTVTIELEPLGPATRVTVRHDGLDAAMSEQHDHGWNLFADRLADAAGRVAGAAP